MHVVLIACIAAACRPIDLVVVPAEGAGAGAGGAGADASAGSGGTIADASLDADTGMDADTGTDADADADAGPVPGNCLDEAVAGVLREGPLPPELASPARTFPQALCSCRGFVGHAALITAVWGGGPGGDVALNDEELNLQADSSVAGSLLAAGPTGISLSAGIALDVGGNLGTNGALQGALAAVSVGGNAVVGDRIDLMDLRVSGTLTQPAGAVLAVSGTNELGAQQTGDVMVQAPCPCGQDEVVDVAALVRAALPGTEPAVPQACPWPASGSGPRALYVAGDLAVRGDFVIGAGPGEDVTLLVEGNVLVEGRIELGSAPHQRRVNLYIGGTGTIQLTTGGTIVGAVYAPNADLVFGRSGEPLTVYGALFVERANADSALTIQHDPALQ